MSRHSRKNIQWRKNSFWWFAWYFVKATLNHFVTLVGTRALYHGLGEIQKSSPSCSMQLFVWFTSITIIVNFRAAISSFYNQFSCTDAENGNQQGSPLSHCFGFIDGTICRGGSRVVQVICKKFFSKFYASALYFSSQSQLAFLFYCLLWNKTKEIFRQSHSKP